MLIFLSALPRKTFVRALERDFKDFTFQLQNQTKKFLSTAQSIKLFYYLIRRNGRREHPPAVKDDLGFIQECN